MEFQCRAKFASFVDVSQGTGFLLDSRNGQGT